MVRGEETSKVSTADSSRDISVTLLLPCTHLTWYRAERALRVHLGLYGDDSFPLRAPAFLTLRLHLKDIGVVGQQVLYHH